MTPDNKARLFSCLILTNCLNSWRKYGDALKKMVQEDEDVSTPFKGPTLVTFFLYLGVASQRLRNITRC